MTIELARSAEALNLRLDLGSGDHPRPGFESVDFFAPSAKHQVNLCRFPWPWADGSVAELFCSHFVEHIPMAYVAADGKTYRIVPEEPTDRDLFTAFFDECHRILKPGGKMTVLVPCAWNDRGFQDPTHRRFLVRSSWAYLSKAWREMHGLGHYLGGCDFEVSVDAKGSPGEELFHKEVQQKRYGHWINTVDDWKVDLKAIKGAPKALPEAFPGVGATPMVIAEAPTK